MEITPQDNSTQPISDDQELAKALAGVLPEDDSTTNPKSPTGLQFEETPAFSVPSVTPVVVSGGSKSDPLADANAIVNPVAPSDQAIPSLTIPEPPTLDTQDSTPQATPVVNSTSDNDAFSTTAFQAPGGGFGNDGSLGGSLGSSSSSSSELDDIKINALKELRPLMDKVELPAEEKFDTYLMLIRSTDDSTLIDPAHRAAQNIGDEKRKAEALLDIIKEIDYLSRKDSPSA